MNCQELFFNLLCIYVVPKSESESWVNYPWNVPYDEHTVSLSLSQMGMSSFDALMDKLNECKRFTSYDGAIGDATNVIYCDEKMTASAKPKTQTAGIQWDIDVKCTAIHPTRDDIAVMARLINEPHDLVLVSDNNDFFLCRIPAEGYQCSAGQSLGTGWRNDVQFAVKNCHGLQLIDI